MIDPRPPVKELDVSSREEFAKACRSDGKYGSVRAVYRHNNSAPKIGIFDAEVRFLLRSLGGGLAN